MTIQLTGKEFDEQFQEADQQAQRDPSDKLDVTYKFDARISNGQRRKVYLREGLSLRTDIHQIRDSLRVNFPERICNNIYFRFSLSGQGQELFASRPNEALSPCVAGKYRIVSNGLQPQMIGDYLDTKPYSFLGVYFCPSVLYPFVPSTDGKLPKNLQHLVRSSSEEAYVRSGNIQLMMATVLQQILHCPYHGMIKRAYLESKAIELVALVLDHEIAIQQEDIKKDTLKPEQLERVHYAREILLRDLRNPPSLEELAHQAGLNDFLLKRGFRQAFGTTVFGELRSHRLEMAKQLLAEQNISVAEVAHQIGYASVTSFTKAFKRQFGLSPRAHQKNCR
ncbi:MAG: helix-turn-helix transcriptional regulator [Leptolyngbya sp. SIO4C1]|nr:helix-turn-helix transcriptional regulator [Leptolyngbya sp. SIO4C1]